MTESDANARQNPPDLAPEPPGATTGAGRSADDSRRDLAEKVSDTEAERTRLDRLVDVDNLVESLRKERDEYLDMARRAQADLSNYRKRIARQQAEQLERAGEAILVRLLPVIDALDAAAGQHPQAVQPLQRLLASVMQAEGVERIEPVGALFDPTVAEAVEHEGDGDVQMVTQVRRAGYRWKGRVLRPASVCVRSQPSGPDEGGSGPNRGTDQGPDGGPGT